ncbi:hypothetical protein C5749_19360 [Sphingobacterium gobiense]|uniref:Uncharacterized protein n=1 Tax=Sphingobacterium gobiense TaxID=1382456 RepID=A0A2S9JCU7_9SPHI|nr:hypothetical protein C5749_19360 [Sphingobacterium gobiense]
MVSLPLHLRPINVVVSHGPVRKPNLVAGFALRCFQRLSTPHVATQPYTWRHNWFTRGASSPVLSY